MNILPFDYTRCHGAQHPLCERCARRQPGRSYWQSYFAEPPLDAQAGRCEWRIGFQDLKDPVEH